MNIQRFHKLAQSLPALNIVQKVNHCLQENNCAVVTAPPGAGKSTLLPITIMQGFPEGKILVLEPRRMAARKIAERMAWLLGEVVGETVGYRIRFESKVSAQTRIEVLTEGVLTRMLISDPTLEGVAAVLFDEFHERSLHSDVALALTRESQQLIRPDLKILIMSATIDTSSLCQSLQAPLVESEGKMFPVDIRYKQDLPVNDFKETCLIITRQILTAYREEQGDILVFLPGEAEILRIQELLGQMPDGTVICPLYGMMNLADQQKALIPSPNGTRKIILSTPIAETSLTIEGVRIVIDSGLCRKLVYDARSGLSHLETVPISMDMAKQRCGRAGRTAPGVCYRMWSKAAESRREECRTPEILEADLSPMILDIAAWGEKNVERLPWLTLPPRTNVLKAASLLQLLGALNEKQELTDLGRKMSLFPCHPRIARMLLTADARHIQLAADVAAILETSSTTLPLKNAGIDITVYIEELEHERHRHGNTSWNRIDKASKYYRQIAQKIEISTEYKVAEADAGTFIAAAYPERIANALKGSFGKFRLASGDIATIDAKDELSGHEWIAIAHMNATGNGHVFLAATIGQKGLEPHAHERDNIMWDNKSGTIIARREYRIGNLLLETKPLHNIDNNLIVKVICEAAHKWGTSMLDFSENVLYLQRRIAAVAQWHPELELPDLSTDSVLQRSEEWLPMYLGKSTSTAELKKIDLCAALWGLLDYSQQLSVDQIAPTHLLFPTGKRIRIEYRQGADLPIVRVRLQDCFGMMDTPRIDNGRRPMLMELLSPGFKPVQLTQDLHSFWTSTYFDVRKELRRRYPKHAWPDNPTEIK